MKTIRPAYPFVRFLALGVLLVAAGAPSAPLSARTAAPPGPHGIGYTVLDHSSPDCEFQWIDISGSGSAVAWTASGDAPAADDGGALVPLAAAFELYGVVATTLVLSANGYVAVAASLGVESGGDYSNDSVLPSVPDNGPGTPLRMLAYHDDLSGADTGGIAYHQFHPTCPRPSGALAEDSCTVLQWASWSAAGDGDSFELQAILYHDGLQIVFQLRPGAGGLEGGTIGIQNAAATVGSQYRPGSALTEDTAVCFFEPRWPPGGPQADLAITKHSKLDDPVPALSAGYSIGVVNRGPSPVTGAQVVDPIPPGLADCSWSCEASPGSACTPFGNGDISDPVDLEPGGWVDYVVACAIAATGADVVNTASVIAPPGVVDPQPEDDSATHVLATVSGRVSSADVLELRRLPSQLELDWGTSCLASDVDYEVYEGALGSFDSHQPIACSTAGSTSLVRDLPAGDTYYVVVPTNATFEGSYGLATGEVERAPGASACLPQSIAACP